LVAYDIRFFFFLLEAFHGFLGFVQLFFKGCIKPFQCFTQSFLPSSISRVSLQPLL
jgi:hypothetical protein